MSSSTRNLLLMIIVIVILAFLFTFVGRGAIYFTENSDDLENDPAFDEMPYFVNWTMIQLDRKSTSVKPPVSIFSLFIVYLGGRTKNKRFNDRSSDLVKFYVGNFKRQLRIELPFCFQLIGHSIDQTCNELLIAIPASIPHKGGISP